MSGKQRDCLQMLLTELTEADGFEEVSVFTAEELQGPADILRAMVTEFGPELISILGEFYFLPMQQEEIWYFSTVLTIAGKIPEAGREELALSMARLNQYLPCGCFVLGEGDSLIYRHTVPVLASETDENKKTLLLTAVNDAMVTAERYEQYLMLSAEGLMTEKQVLETAFGIKAED